MNTPREHEDDTQPQLGIPRSGQKWPDEDPRWLQIMRRFFGPAQVGPYQEGEDPALEDERRRDAARLREAGGKPEPPEIEK